jgi:hypothetical protein
MSQLPEKYMQIGSTGMGVNGIFLNIVQLAFIFSGEETDKKAWIHVNIFYGISGTCLLIGSIMYFVENKNAF